MLLGVVAPMSAFAEDRPDRGTYDRDVRVAPRGDIAGVVLWVARDGDDFALRTNRGEVRIDAKGGVPVYYGRQQYRVRDLERGDRVAVDLRGNGRNSLKARSVQLLSSNARGRFDDGRYGRNDGRTGDDRYRTETLQGRVISFDERQGLMYLEIAARDTIAVDVRSLARYEGRDWSRGLRGGDYVSVSGQWNGRVLIAQRIDEFRERR
jgi:hypothetical protein